MRLSRPVEGIHLAKMSPSSELGGRTFEPPRYSTLETVVTPLNCDLLTTVGTDVAVSLAPNEHGRHLVGCQSTNGTLPIPSFQRKNKPMDLELITHGSKYSTLISVDGHFGGRHTLNHLTFRTKRASNAAHQGRALCSRACWSACSCANALRSHTIYERVR